MQRSGLLTVAVVVVLAGCAGFQSTPTPTPGGNDGGADPPYFVVENAGSETWELRLFLTDGVPRDFDVTFANGTTRTVDQNYIPFNATTIRPANEVLAQVTYTVEPDSNLFVSLRGCEADTGFWYLETRPGRTDWGYGPGYACQGYTGLLQHLPNGGGGSFGDDYSDYYDDPGTVRRTLSANASG